MIFLDNASTTEIYEEVNKKLYEINKNSFYNPSALYQNAIDTSNLLNDAKKQLAKNLGTSAEHIIFTSGATEANNLAIIGSLTGKKDAEYIFSLGEHPSVFNVANNLKTQNKNIKFIDIKDGGIVDENSLRNNLNENTHFVSIIHVSNETGAINNIKKLCSIIKDYNSNILVHVDGTQAFGKISVDIENLGVDLYTISAHKFHGPKGVGALYVKNLQKLKPIILGGGQQNGMRSGTENVSGNLAMALASEISTKNLKGNFDKVLAFKNYFKQKIAENCTEYIINEAPENSPYILSVSFKGIRGEVLLHMLEKQGVLIGTGSACSSKKQNNRVLENLKLSKEYMLGSIRISFSSFNTQEEIEKASNIFIEQYKQLKLNMEK